MFYRYILIFYLSSFLISCSHLSEKKTSENIFLLGCKILDSSFNVIKTLNSSNLCQVLPDGGWIVSKVVTLERYEKDGKLRWIKSGSYHHQINLSDDYRTILVMGSTFVKKDGITTCFDTLELLSDLDGSLIAQYDLAKNIFDFRKYRSTKTNFTIWPVLPFVKNTFNADIKFSHFNSFYEIPNEARDNEWSYIAHDTISGVCLVFNSTLDKITHHYFTNISKNETAHDCQMLPDKSIIYYVNSSLINDLSQPGIRIFRQDLAGHVEKLFPKDQSNQFYAPFKGGVEILSDQSLLVSVANNNKTHIILIDNEGKIIQVNTTNIEYQQVKKINFDRFLKLNEVF